MKRVGTFFLLFSVGMLVFFVGGYWGAGMSYSTRTAVKIILPAVLLIATLACRRVDSLSEWYRVSLGFLAASTAFLASWLVSGPLLRAFDLSTSSFSGLAFAKLFDALPIVVTAVLVARLGGLKPADLQLRKGRMKQWLAIGLITFVGFAGLFLLQARSQGVDTDRLLSLAPWILLFVLSNSFMEELHFRGLLLGSFEQLIGRHGANACIALFFTLVHMPVQYTPDIVAFLAGLFVLALAWGYVIQRTQALWGSVLFHAGADLTIMLGIYETYGSA